MFICSSALLIPLITSPLNHCNLPSGAVHHTHIPDHTECNCHPDGDHLRDSGKNEREHIHSLFPLLLVTLTAICYGDAVLTHFRVMTLDPSGQPDSQNDNAFAFSLFFSSFRFGSTSRLFCPNHILHPVLISLDRCKNQRQ